MLCTPPGLTAFLSDRHLEMSDADVEQILTKEHERTIASDNGSYATLMTCSEVGTH